MRVIDNEEHVTVNVRVGIHNFRFIHSLRRVYQQTSMTTPELPFPICDFNEMTRTGRTE